MATTNIISDYLENKLVNHLFRNTVYTPPSNKYLALYTSDPTDAHAGTEVSAYYNNMYTNYQRAVCPLFTISGGSASAITPITFPHATARWGTITHIGIRDTSVGGNLLFHGSLSSPLLIEGDDNVTIDPLSITLLGDGNGGWGSGITTTILDFVLNNNAFSTPGLSVYMGLGRSVFLDDNSNILSWSEIAGSGYTRKQIAGTAWSTPSGGTTTNVAQLSFTDSAPANWGTITHIALFNSSSANNAFLIWGKLVASRTVLLGDGLLFNPGKISISIL